MCPMKIETLYCAGASTASDVAVVMALLLGHEDSEERAAGVLGVGGAPAKTAPRSRSRGQAQR